MSESSNNKSLVSFSKTLLFSSLFSLLLLLAIIVVASVVLQSVNSSEQVYDIIVLVAYFFLGFFSTKITTARYSHALLPLIIAQATLNVLILALLTLITTKQAPSLNRMAFSYLIIFASALVSLVLRGKQRKKNK